MKGNWLGRLKDDIRTAFAGNYGDFDIGRLTILGWLWALANLAVVVAGAAGVMALFDDVVDQNQVPRGRGWQRLVGLPLVLVLVVVMMLSRYLLEDLGLVLIRPPKVMPGN